jgi:hypothetical protein
LSSGIAILHQKDETIATAVQCVNNKQSKSVSIGLITIGKPVSKDKIESLEDKEAWICTQTGWALKGQQEDMMRPVRRLASAEGLVKSTRKAQMDTTNEAAVETSTSIASWSVRYSKPKAKAKLKEPEPSNEDIWTEILQDDEIIQDELEAQEILRSKEEIELILEALEHWEDKQPEVFRSPEDTDMESESNSKKELKSKYRFLKKVDNQDNEQVEEVE